MDLSRRIIQKNILFYKFALWVYTKLKGIKISFNGSITIKKRNKIIVLNSKHINHVRGTVDYFGFFHNSVVPRIVNKQKVVDFSQAHFHDVSDFILPRLHMPSIAEPIQTAKIYAELLELERGMRVIDLGSYAGVTGIFFSEMVSEEGGVVCVEPDPLNFASLEINLNNYFQKTGKYVTRFNAAIYKEDTFINFVSEGSMDSAILGNAENLMIRQDHIKKIQAITLSTLMQMANLNEVDCMKLDIEGSEYDAFQDSNFFNNFHPKIILEPISMKGPKGATAIIEQLSKFGYRHKIIPQIGARVPLILFN